MEEFREREFPLSVCIVDMDWHTTQTGNRSVGWTGYTWNRDLFPDPAGFIAWLHEQGLRTALNLHPADGVHPHEEAYAEMAAAVGIDPATGEPVEFDSVDPRFVEAYFKFLHHPQEAIGVDFWWLDWQQGKQSKLQGLDPLWWLNHLHFYDLGRDGVKRPFIFSRWGGLGNHRYPIGFSGDTVVSWASLANQPYFTATAANVGYGWWSHDIGGHMWGVEDAELYLRWVQYGVFSPILRLHSTNNPYQDRRPWGWGPAVEEPGTRGHATAPRADPLPLQHGVAQPRRGHPAGDAALLHQPGRGRRLQLPASLLVWQRVDRRALHRADRSRPGLEPPARLAARRPLVRLLHGQAVRGRLADRLRRLVGRSRSLPGRAPSCRWGRWPAGAAWRIRRS